MVELIVQTHMHTTPRTQTLLLSVVANHPRHMQQVFGFWNFMRISERIEKFHLRCLSAYVSSAHNLWQFQFHTLLHIPCRRTISLLCLTTGWAFASTLRCLEFISLYWVENFVSYV